MMKFNSSERTNLREFLVKHFNFDELLNLAFDLGIDFESIPHGTKQEFCRELITYFERRKKLNLFITEVLRNRPDDAFAISLLAKLPALEQLPSKVQSIISIELLNDWEERLKSSYEKRGDQLFSEKKADKAKEQYLQAVHYIQQNKHDFDNINLSFGRLYRKIGDYYYRHSDFINRALEYYEKGLDQLKSPKTIVQILEKIRLLEAQSIVFIDLSRPSDAINQLEDAKKLLDSIPKSIENGRMFEILAIANRELGARDDFLKYIVKAQEEFEAIKEKEQVLRLKVNLAIDAIHWGKPEEAIKIQLENKRGFLDSSLWSKVCLNMSIAYTDMGDLHNAKDYAELSLKLSEQDGDILGQIKALASFAEIYKDKTLLFDGESEKKHLYLKETINVVNKAKGIAKFSNQTSTLSDPLIDMYRIVAEACLGINNYALAKKWLTKANHLIIQSINNSPIFIEKVNVVKAHFNLKHDEDLSTATERIKNSIDVFIRHNEWKEVIPTQILHARWLIKYNNFQEATEVLEEALNYIQQGHCKSKKEQVNDLIKLTSKLKSS